jgi:hypothetical protein
MTLDLSDDEALVLFELLHAYGSNDDGRELKIQNAAERNALWALSAQLEKRLVLPFERNYADLLSKARARVEELGGPW